MFPGDQYQPDIVYNSTTGLWNCCGTGTQTGEVTCDDPTDQTFQAPAPEKLLPFSLSSTSISSQLSSTLTSAPTSSPGSGSGSSIPSSTLISAPAAATNSTASSDGSSLSAGAKAGISVGVIAGVGCAIFLALWLVIARWRRRSAKSSASNGDATAAGFAEKQQIQHRMQELHGRDRSHELQGQCFETELDSMGAVHGSNGRGW